MKKFLTILLCLLIVCPPSEATNQYWVDLRNGSDGNPGTQAQPWKTLIWANQHWVMGTTGTCAAASGYFSETAGVCIHVASTGGTGVAATANTFDRGGTSEALRVVYVADAKWGPIMQFIDSGATTDFWTTAPYNTFAGFDASSGAGSGTFNRNMYLMQSAAPHTHFMKNRLHDAALGLCTGHGGAGIADYDQASPPNFDTVADGNWVFNIGPTGANSGGTCRFYRGMYMAGQVKVTNNVVFHNAENGIAVTHQQQGTGSVVSGNTVYNNGGAGWGNNPIFDAGNQICCTPGGHPGASPPDSVQGIGDGITVAADPGFKNIGITVTNNVVYNNGAANSKGPGSGTPACGIVVASQGGAVINGLFSGNLVSNDQAANSFPGSIPCGTQFQDILITNPNTNTGNVVTGNIHGSPQFVNYQPDGTGDYHPQTGSPLIKGGTTAVAAGAYPSAVPPTDFEGTPQSSPPVIGAFLPKGSGSAPPGPPTSLSIVAH